MLELIKNKLCKKLKMVEKSWNFAIAWFEKKSAGWVMEGLLTAIKKHSNEQESDRSLFPWY